MDIANLTLILLDLFKLWDDLKIMANYFLQVGPYETFLANDLITGNFFVVSIYKDWSNPVKVMA